MKQKTIYHYEWQGMRDVFFDEKFNLLTCWDLNDAHYRHEYMSPLFAKLGYVVEDLPEGMQAMADSLMEKW